MRQNLGKILIIVLPILAALILLFPTYNSSRLEQKERESLELARKAASMEDSIKIMDNFYRSYGEDLAGAKKGRLKLGLDLRGGMYVTMEVDIVKLIEESAQSESIDEIFVEVLEKTEQDASASEESAIDIFLRNFSSLARPKGKTLLNYFETDDFRDISEASIIEKLNLNADQAIDQAQEVIRQRIDQYGVSEPNIQKSGARRVVLELPGVQNRTEMMNLLQTTARLEFKLVRNNEQIVKAFAKVDKYLSDMNKRKQGILVSDSLASPGGDSASLAADTSVAESSGGDTTTDTTKLDSAAGSNPQNPYEGLPEEEAQKRYLADHPFTSLFSTFYFQGTGDMMQPVNFGYITAEVPEGEYMFRISKDSMNLFNMMLNRSDIRSFLPIDIQIAIDAKPDQQILKQNNYEVYDFYALKKDAELTGDVITDAKATFDPTTNVPLVSMQMNADGSESWSRITGANINKRIAVVLDDRVYTAPNVQNKITGGNSQITGMSNSEEAHLLEIVLKAGALKAPIKIIEERIVGPSLGEDSINSGLWASIGAAILVIIFMLLYYSTAGLIADIAVVINVSLILATLAALGGTLTLPGIAGIILTMGMAVDANVLIFERVREELAKGRSLRSSVDDGYKKAMSAIIDSNVTTFITGLVLYYFGSGPIQGFALTLMIGIIGTLFTAIFVSKAVTEIALRDNGTMSFGQSKNSHN